MHSTILINSKSNHVKWRFPSYWKWTTNWIFSKLYFWYLFLFRFITGSKSQAGIGLRKDISPQGWSSTLKNHIRSFLQMKSLFKKKNFFLENSFFQWVRKNLVKVDASKRLKSLNFFYQTHTSEFLIKYLVSYFFLFLTFSRLD